MKTTPLRWTARALSAGLVALFVVLVIGEGPPPFWPLSLHTLLAALLVACHAGLLIAWRWELVGGLLAMSCMAGFYLVDFANSGFERFPGGWVFPSLFFTGLLFVVAATAHGGRTTWRKSAGLSSRPQ